MNAKTNLFDFSSTPAPVFKTETKSNFGHDIPPGKSVENEFEPKYKQFANYVDRLHTFKYWPLQMTQFPSEMARAGFFYDRTTDNTICFWCGKSVFKWLQYENPVGEHKRLHGVCKFLEMNYIV